MRPTLMLLTLALVAGVSRAEPAAVDAGLAAVADLGRINGLALACGHAQVVARAKELMLTLVPKTRAYGEAYEAATSQAFTRVPGGCGEATALRLEAEVAATRIQAALAAAR